MAGVGQDLFIGRMAAHANGVGYPPPDQSQEDWQQVTEVMSIDLDPRGLAPTGYGRRFSSGRHIYSKTASRRKMDVGCCAHQNHPS